MNTPGTVTTRFFAHMIAESVAHDPDVLAEELVRNDQRLATGAPYGEVIALALDAVTKEQRK